MTNPFKKLSARSIRLIFTSLMIAVLFISGVNFLDVVIFKATSNDQCGWLNRPEGEPGALITEVAPGGVTDRAGIKDGDILLEINGRPFRTPAEAMRIINPMRAGDTATYLIERNGVQFEAKVEMLKLVNPIYLGYCLLGISFLAVGYVVVMTRPQGKTQRLFAYYTLATMLVFCLSSLAIDPSVDAPWKIISLATGFGIGRFIAIPAFVMFFLHFPVRRKILDRRWFKIVLFVFSAATVLPFFLDWIRYLPPETVGGYVNLPFIFYLIGLVLFVHSYFRRVERDQRRQLRPILFAVLAGIVTMAYLVTVQSLHPFILFTQPAVYSPIVLLAAVPVAFGYSIFRYRLMDIDLIVKRSLVYGAITAMIAALYLGMVFGVGNLLGALFGEQENTLLNILAFLVIAFAFDPVKRTVQDWIDRLFYRERLNYQQALLEFSQELPSQMNLDQILQSMVNRISGTMHVDRVAVVLCDEKEGCTSVGKNVPIQCCSFGDEVGGVLELLRQTRTPLDLGLVALEPDSVRIHDADKKKILEGGIVLVVPMFLQDRLIGMIAVGPKLSDRAYSREDINLLATVASQAAIAIENARLHQAEIDRQKIEEELALARRIQQGLLPKTNPRIEGLDIAGVAIPAQIVGGDYYDFIEVGPKKLLVVVADVSGKGMSAALYMSKIQGMVQLAAHMYQSPREMLTHVNRRIYDGIERKSFITMILALFDLERREVSICRAGHNKALMASNGQLEYLEAQGIGLGLERGPVFENTLKEVQRPLERGGMFFFYTDGLTEAMNEQRVQLGEEKVKSLVEQKRNLSAVEIQRSLTNAVEQFVGKAERHDDLTMVVVKVV